MEWICLSNLGVWHEQVHPPAWLSSQQLEFVCNKPSVLALALVLSFNLWKVRSREECYFRDSIWRMCQQDPNWFYFLKWYHVWRFLPFSILPPWSKGSSVCTQLQQLYCVAFLSLVPWKSIFYIAVMRNFLRPKSDKVRFSF